jgi:uncharacterized protein YjbI with pentapeptide repeats
LSASRFRQARQDDAIAEHKEVTSVRELDEMLAKEVRTFHRAQLADQDLSCRDLRGKDFTGADLKRVNWFGVKAAGMDLAHADIRGAKNLREAVNFGDALFFHTTVTEEERQYITHHLRPHRVAHDSFDAVG